MKISWKRRDGIYNSVDFLYLGKFKVAHLCWSLSKGKDGESWESKIYLPGIESRKLFLTKEDAMAYVEGEVRDWMVEANKD